MLRRPALASTVLATLALLPLLSTLVACGGETGGQRVLVLGLDGMDPRVVDLMMSEGKLPNFARMRQEGAYGELLSQKPLLSPVVWTTVATGQTPDRHGIGHFVAVSATGEELPATSEMRRVPALWTIASDHEKEVAVVGWWATWPPEPVNGWMVSDHVAYHFLFEEGATGGGEQETTHPPELAEEIAPLVRRPGDLSPEELAPYVNVAPEELDRPFDFEDELSHFRWALAAAQTYRDVGLELWEEKGPDLELVYVEGTDSASHLFGHLFRAEGLAGELAAQQERYGETVEAMYGLADEIVGRYMEAAEEADAALVVLSDHGFELGALHDDPTKTRDLRRVSERFHREEGILYMWGKGVKAARLDRPSILDVAPTVLTLLGVPPSKEMPGRVLLEGLHRDDAPERVESHGGTGGPVADGGAGTEDDATREARLEHLRSLGYLGDGGGDAGGDGGSETTSPQGDRNLAAIHFENGRFEESAAIYRRLVEDDPDDPALRASLAGALGALGRYEEAEEQLARAVEIEPLNPEAWHNRAVVAERSGDVETAARYYRKALEARPGYEPAAAAMARLTGTAELWPADTPERREARGLADRAAELARRGDFGGARELLDQAVELAPEYPLLYQYRANVAYLADDLDRAREALERGLELEPGNLLFENNLRQLEAEGDGDGQQTGSE